MVKLAALVLELVTSASDPENCAAAFRMIMPAPGHIKRSAAWRY